jgi:putative aldouronate transport system permease protein
MEKISVILVKKGYFVKKPSDVIMDFIIFVFCIFIFLITAYPLYFVIIASFSDAIEVNAGRVIIWPVKQSLYGYEKIFKDTRIWLGYKNTLNYTFFGTIINLFFTLPAAYVLSRKKFTPRKIIMALFIFTMFFNGGLIPTYMLIRNLKIINTVWVMIIPFCVSVYNLIIARTFLETSIPEELYEAAMMDGCSHFRYFITVILPLSKAVISVIGLYYFVGHWNNFFRALMYLSRDGMQPLQVVLRNILLSNQVFMQGAGIGAGEGTGAYAQQYADQIKYGIIIVSTLPVLCLYPLIQRYFEKGVMIGAIKG